MVECMLHMHVSDMNVLNFKTKIPFKEGRM